MRASVVVETSQDRASLGPQLKTTLGGLEKESVEKNPDYWGGWSDDKFDRVIIKIVLENATQVQMLRAGDADFISIVPADAMATLDAEEGITTARLPSWKNSQYLLNTKKYPTDNKMFRQALTRIWDYETVVKEIYADSAQVATGPRQ